MGVFCGSPAPPKNPLPLLANLDVAAALSPRRTRKKSGYGFGIVQEHGAVYRPAQDAKIKKSRDPLRQMGTTAQHLLKNDSLCVSRNVFSQKNRCKFQHGNTQFVIFLYAMVSDAFLSMYSSFNVYFLCCLSLRDPYSPQPSLISCLRLYVVLRSSSPSLAHDRTLPPKQDVPRHSTYSFSISRTNAHCTQMIGAPASGLNTAQPIAISPHDSLAMSHHHDLCLLHSTQVSHTFTTQVSRSTQVSGLRISLLLCASLFLILTHQFSPVLGSLLFTDVSWSFPSLTSFTLAHFLRSRGSFFSRLVQVFLMLFHIHFSQKS